MSHMCSSTLVVRANLGMAINSFAIRTGKGIVGSIGPGLTCGLAGGIRNCHPDGTENSELAWPKRKPKNKPDGPRLRRDRGLTWALGRKGPGTDPQAAKLDETPLSDVEWVAFAAISRRARPIVCPLRHPLLVLFCHQFGLFSLVSALILDNIPIGGSLALSRTF